ncbi:MAG: RNA polymerase sigma factor [Rhodothermales bacterium]
MDMPSSDIPQDDRALIEAFKSGDEFAFVSLYNRYKAAVYAFCVKMLLNREQARDAMQETFLRVYENRERLIKTDSFRSWLYTIARNQCLNQLRRNNWQVAFEPQHEESPSLRPDRETPIQELEKSEQIELVNRYLATLKPDYREVIVLREYQNLTYEEIAAITRSSLSAVKSRLFKARRTLAKYLEDALGSEAPKIGVE